MNLFFQDEKITVPAQVLRSGTYITVDPRTRKQMLLDFSEVPGVRRRNSKYYGFISKQQELRFKGLI